MAIPASIASTITTGSTRITTFNRLFFIFILSVLLYLYSDKYFNVVVLNEAEVSGKIKIKFMIKDVKCKKRAGRVIFFSITTLSALLLLCI